MRTSFKLATLALGSAAVLPFVGTGTAFAADGNVAANLKPVALNGVNGSGMASVAVKGTTLTVTMAASGLLAGSPHAAHIHFGADARHECPTASDDAKDDGTLNTTDGAPVKYDGATKSDLDPKLPTAATDPALCGALSAMPSGGVATGAGGTASGTSSEGMLALGGGLILVAAGSGVYSIRRARAQA